MTTIDDNVVAEINSAVEEEVAEGNNVEVAVFSDNPEDTETPEEESQEVISDSDRQEADEVEDDKIIKEANEEGSEEGNKSGDEGEVSLSSTAVTTPPDQPQPPSLPAISNVALQRAVRAGLDLGDAQQFPSEAVLLRTVERMEVTKEAPAEDPFDAIPKLDPEQYDKEIIETFDTMKTMLRDQRDQIKLLAQGANEREQAVSHETSREIEQWFDGAISKLGEDFADALGKGGHYSLTPGSSQFVKREAIADQVGILMAGYNAAGREAPSRDDLFDTAARSILKDDYQVIRDRKTAAELKSRKGQHLARNSGTKVTKDRPVEDEVADELDAEYFS